MCVIFFFLHVQKCGKIERIERFISHVKALLIEQNMLKNKREEMCNTSISHVMFIELQSNPFVIHGIYTQSLISDMASRTRPLPFVSISLSPDRFESAAIKINFGWKWIAGADRPNEYARPGIVFPVRTFIRKSSIITDVGARNQRDYIYRSGANMTARFSIPPFSSSSTRIIMWGRETFTRSRKTWRRKM